MKSHKSSILLVTLLILLAASIFALLSLNSIRFLINNSALNYQYLSSKYLAKGASEIELLKSKKYVLGIEDMIISGSDTVIKNMNLTYKNSYFESLSKVLGSGLFCMENGLSGVILPLFRWGDPLSELSFKGGELKTLDSIDHISIFATGAVVVALVPEKIEDLYLNPSSYKIYSTNASFSNPIKLNSLSYNPDEKNFLVVLIKSGENKVCLSSYLDTPLPYQVIYSFSSVGKFRIGEKVVRQFKLPGWLIYMVIGS